MKPQPTISRSGIAPQIATEGLVKNPKALVKNTKWRLSFLSKDCVSWCILKSPSAPRDRCRMPELSRASSRTSNGFSYYDVIMSCEVTEFMKTLSPVSHPRKPGYRALKDTLQQPSFWAALRFWCKLGWISFGGTAAHIAIMHDELVEKKRWISNGRFLHALSHCMILPGP